MEALGIEPIYLLAQLVNFAIIFFLLRKFLYKPVLTMLDKRRKEVAESLDQAKVMEEEQAKMKERSEKLITEARKDAKAIVDEAKKQIDVQKKELLAKAHEQAAEIVAKAKVQAQKDLKANEETMRRQAVEMASIMVERLIPDVMSDADHRKLIAAHLKDIEKRVAQIN